MIICCTPESTHAAESLSTLRFGERAKKIKNNAKVAFELIIGVLVSIPNRSPYSALCLCAKQKQVNEELSPRELKNLLTLAKREIATLKKRLSLFEGEAPTSRPPLIRSGSQSTVSQSQSQSDEDDNVTVNLLGKSASSSVGVVVVIFCFTFALFQRMLLQRRSGERCWKTPSRKTVLCNCG